MIFKWLIVGVIVYFMYRWIQGKPVLPPVDRRSIDDNQKEEIEYTDYEEVDDE